MAFKLESTYDGAGTIQEDLILMKDSEAGAEGEAMVASAGRLTKCATTGLPQFILAQTTAAGTNVKTTYVRIRPDQVYLVDISGTVSLVTAAIGTKVACMTADGLKLDAATLTGGNIEIISVDTVKSKARIRFNL